MSDGDRRLLALTAQIAAAYLEAHVVEATAVPNLVRDIHRTLASLEEDVQTAVERPRLMNQAAVEPEKSVFPNHLVCLEDGMKVTMLKPHLKTAHRLTPEQYRAKWSLPAHYPMTAPNYAKLRSKLAKESGLGHHRKR
jgi:predicted transcriptional regulator